MNRRPIAITCGDPAGVGPELIESWLKDNQGKESQVTPIGPALWIKRLGVSGISVGPNDYQAQPGKPDEVGQRVALAAMERAAEGCSNGEFSAVVTGPINKHGLASIGFSHPGQTEFFAKKWAGEPVMAFAGGKMTVALVTWHIPLREVADHLNAENIERSILALVKLRQKLGDKEPRIAVCGLNPHAGENGMLGKEDGAIIQPLVEKLCREGLKITGPLPGDTAFHRHLKGEFDGVVAMYHDQGLGPLKTVDFSEAANLTLGLRFVRTSPDHGTAYDLAGTHQADRRSLDSAIRLAAKLQE